MKLAAALSTKKQTRMQPSTFHLRTPSPRSALLAAALIAWTGCVGLGWWAAADYGFATVADATSAVPGEWPSDSMIERAVDGPTLLVFLHPRCPCSQATISELERLVAATPAVELPAIRIVASAPAGAGDEWWASPLVARACQLPGAHLVRDADGQEANRFGARVSGTTLLFNQTGALIYAGGVTIGRGHEGASTGLAAVARLLRNPSSREIAVPPFGCELVRQAGVTTCQAAMSSFPTAEGDRR